MLNEWYSVQELTGLPGMSQTPSGVIRWLKKNLPTIRSQLRTKGKGLEYHIDSLPVETRQYLAEQVQQKVLASMPVSVEPAVVRRQAADVVIRRAEVLDTLLADATDKQVATFTARKVVLRELENLSAHAGISISRACQVLLVNARAGLLNPNKLSALKTARDPRGKPSADGLPSLRRLQAWVEQKESTGATALVPRASAAPDMTPKAWHAVVMALYCVPQKRTAKTCHEMLVDQWQHSWGYPPGAPAPSYHAVLRFLEKVSEDDKLAGRFQGSALRAKRFYQHRTTEGLRPFDEVHADGWNTHFSAPHPTTGEYVTYEVWHYQCVRTKYLTRMSIGLSESSEVILQGLKNCIAEWGVPAILQTDSTGSIKNDQVEFDPVASISARMGLSVVHPVEVGNSQANGIAENFNTWLDREARKLATYQHPERMDALAFKKVRKFTNAMVRAGKSGDIEAQNKARKAALKHGDGLLFESAAQAEAWIHALQDKWNDHPHRSLPKVRDAAGKLVHMSPRQMLEAEIKAGWEPTRLSDRELVDAFRLHVRKFVRRGTVSPYAGQRYRHTDLAQWEGQEVMVAVDPHEWQHVWVKDLDGRVIAQAEFVAATGYRAQTVYEAALAKRATAQIKRREQQIDAIVERMAPPALEAHAVEVFELPPSQQAPLPVVVDIKAATQDTQEADDPFAAYLRRRHIEAREAEIAKDQAELAEMRAHLARIAKEQADDADEPYLKPAQNWTGY